MSNNIYDILKKIESLEAPKKTLTESKMTTVKELHNESKKEKQTNKGTIAEAVAQVEKQLSEKFHTHKKAVQESGLMYHAGVQKHGKKYMDMAKEAGQKGASQEELGRLKDKHSKAYKNKKMDEAVDQEGPADLLAAVEQEINNPGRSIDNLTDVLNATFGSDRSPEFKKARAVIGKYIDLVDNAAMGSEQDGIAPMRGGNIARHIQQYDLTDYLQHAAAMLDKAVKGPMDEGNYNEEMLSPKQKSFAALAEPKDKITYADKIAGAKKGKKDEGNEFSGELVKARAHGKDSFEVDGKSYPVKEDNADFLGGDNPVDHRGHLRLSPAGAAKVQNHPKYDPNRSANAQYSDHFDDRGYQRMTHDQAVEVGKNPKYNPNLPANAQWDLLNKPGSTPAMKEGELSAKEKWMNPDNTFKNPKTDAEWARIHKSRRDYEADLAKDGIKPPPFHLKSDDDAALRKARSQDQTDRDADRGTLNRLGNYGSRLFFGSDIPVNEGGKSMREGWEEMQKYLDKKRGPQSKGGEGKKAGTRYGGSAQKDDDEDTDGEGKPVEKKKGRPKGTGGGAKFSFKKPKD